MLKTRIAIIITLIVLTAGFVGFHLVERTLHGGRAPSLLEEVLFIGGLVLGVSLLVACIFRLRLIKRVNQVSARALEILHANNWAARLEEGQAEGDLGELSGAVNRLLEAADTSQQELRESEQRLAAQSQALTELTSRQTGVSVTVGDRLRLIVETCARTLKVARVSIWRFEDNGATIRCDDLYQHTTGHLNRHFEFLWESPMFATALSALIDPRDRSVTIACAGHPPPLLLRNGQVSVVAVDATMPVLMMDLPNVPDVRHALQSGDRLLFYTDGVTERSDPADEMYDLPRLTASFERMAHQY